MGRLDPSRLFDMRARLFVSRLHRHILQGDRCFTSGAFVIEVPTSPKFATFVKQLRQQSTRRPFAATHDWFQKQAKFAGARLCKNACTVNARWLSSDSQMEYVFKPPLVGLCGSKDVAPKRVMLWYMFRVGSTRYMFMKLESFPAVSVRHAWGAIGRYVLKTKKASMFPSRRENARKNKTSGENVSSRAAQLSSQDVRALWPSSHREAQVYNQSVRTGFEMFVPATLANTL